MRTLPTETPSVSVIPGAKAVEDAADMVFALDREGRIAFANRAAESVTGRRRTELLGRSFAELVSDPETWEPGEIAVCRPDGTLVWVEVTTWGSADHVWGIARDVTERRKELHVLRHKAFHDPLTELPNRDLFDDRVQQAVNVSSRTGRPLALMLLDLDGFKEVNDRHGHPCGDEVLRVVAARMRESLRSSDTVARVGGDEFGVLLPEGDAEEAAHVAMKLRRCIREPVTVGDDVVDIDVSVGIATYPADGPDMAALIAAADAAMYGVKRRSGGGAAVVSRHGRSVEVAIAPRRSRRRAAATLAAALVLAMAWVPDGSGLKPGAGVGSVSAAPSQITGGPLGFERGSDGGRGGVSGPLAVASGRASWWQEVSAGLTLVQAGRVPDAALALRLPRSDGAPRLPDAGVAEPPPSAPAPEPAAQAPGGGPNGPEKAPPGWSAPSPGKGSPSNGGGPSFGKPSSPPGSGSAKTSTPAAGSGSSNGLGSKGGSSKAAPSQGKGR